MFNLDRRGVVHYYEKSKSGLIKFDKVYIKKEKLKEVLKRRNRKHQVKVVKEKGKEIGCYVCS
jgi:hypothetical protein